MFKVIGLSGKAGSGKDYLANNVFRAKYGYFPLSLAWHFKIWLAGKGQATYDEVFTTKPPHIRRLLQQEGTELGRMVYGENVWLETAYNWMRLFNEQWGIEKFIISDVRFENEVSYIQSKGGKVFRIIAPQRVAESKLTPEARLHISETALDGKHHMFDEFIYNNPEQQPYVETQIDDLMESMKNYV